MGLDMYLSVNYFGENPPEDFPVFTSYSEKRFFDGMVKFTVMYWRKANAIHQWFVNNYQGGVDECQESDPISAEGLKQLLELVEKVLAEPDKASDYLPTEGGFFFGSTDYDSWYFEDLQQTQKELTGLLDYLAQHPDLSVAFRYRSSW